MKSLMYGIFLSAAAAALVIFEPQLAQAQPNFCFPGGGNSVPPGIPPQFLGCVIQEVVTPAYAYGYGYGYAYGYAYAYDHNHDYDFAIVYFCRSQFPKQGFRESHGGRAGSDYWFGFLRRQHHGGRGG